MDELSEDDKLTVARARKVQRFMSQPFTVAEVFTGTKGVFVPLADTIAGASSLIYLFTVNSNTSRVRTCHVTIKSLFSTDTKGAFVPLSPPHGHSCHTYASIHRWHHTHASLTA